MPTAVESLELVGVGQRVEGARFELRDIAGEPIGAVTPNKVVSIENRADGVLKRTITNFVLSPDVEDDVNTLTDRVFAYSVIDGVEYPLGLFLFAARAGNRRSYGLTASTRLLDQGLILGQPIPNTIGFSAGAIVTDALRLVFAQAGFLTPDVVSAVADLSSPQAWPAGSTTFAKVASDLCGLGGLCDWYFDNTGQLRVINAPNLSTVIATYAYGDNGRIIADSIIEENDLLNAPNRYIVVDSSSRDTPIVGRYDLPNGAPNSYGQRGFYIAKTIDAPGVGTVVAADAYAQSYAQTDAKAYETVTFSAAPDPRHDTFDVIEYYGINYQELSWRLTLAPGGPHQHTIKRIFYV